ncbi:LOW QUALITY PROTEIN: pro-opiomelanocortin-like [Menidia menidia]
MSPVWLLVAVVVVVGGAKGAAGQCWEQPGCQELNSESSMMECIQLCRSDLTDEVAMAPGTAHLESPPPPPSAPPSAPPTGPQTKRSYSMEHFRWGKPVGRKRRPVKVVEEPEEVFGARRRELEGEELKEEGAELLEEGEELKEVEEKKDGAYKMKHFRWNGPPTGGKRYGGFMKGWEGGHGGGGGGGAGHGGGGGGATAAIGGAPEERHEQGRAAVREA